VVAAKALVFDMPKVKILPHPEICPEGAEFELNDDECRKKIKTINKI
jgi:hypothetical protein